MLITIIRILDDDIFYLFDTIFRQEIVLQQATTGMSLYLQILSSRCIEEVIFFIMGGKAVAGNIYEVTVSAELLDLTFYCNSLKNNRSDLKVLLYTIIV